MFAIIKPKPNHQLYTADLNGQKIRVYAPSFSAAKEQVDKHLKSTKTNSDVVWVVSNSSPETQQ